MYESCSETLVALSLQVASQPQSNRGETSHLDSTDESEDEGFEHDLDMEEEQYDDDDGPEYIDPRPVKPLRSATKLKHITRPTTKKARATPGIPRVGGKRAAATSHDVKDASINDDNSLFSSFLVPRH